MDKKDEILDKLSKLSVDQLDKLRDSKQVEMRELLKKLYKAKDDELTLRFNKRKELIAEGNSLSKTEQLLKGDEELYGMKKLVLGYTALKKQLEIELELLKDFFWKAKT